MQPTKSELWDWLKAERKHNDAERQRQRREGVPGYVLAERRRGRPEQPPRFNRAARRRMGLKRIK